MVFYRFKKFQGTGNDFIMLDNLTGEYDNLTIEHIQRLCDRRFGIGADGLIKIDRSSDSDFFMDYYNSDGSKSFCGNGARCAVVFASTLGLVRNNRTCFTAIDGDHSAELTEDDWVRLKMNDVVQFSVQGSTYVMNTGSPHYVEFGVQGDSIVEFGKAIRYSAEYEKEGINVNLVRTEGGNELFVETYERGVEDETLSCGTGVTACALAHLDRTHQIKGQIHVRTKGGDLSVDGIRSGTGFTEVYLSGPAKFVFEGSMEIE
jgi:diaminopimelate epimerase